MAEPWERPDPLADPRESKPAETRRPGAPPLTVEGTCGREASGFLGVFRCQLPTAWAGQLACAHEHFLNVEVCSVHRGEFSANMARQVCQPCLSSGGRSHNCPVVLVREITLSPAEAEAVADA